MQQLKDTISNDMKIALKNQNKEELSALRMLLSAIQYGQTAAKPISALDSVLGYRKQLIDALELYPAESEKHKSTLLELNIVSRYLPKVPTEEELRDHIKDLIKQSSEVTKINAGSIMKELKNLFPTIDGKQAITLIQQEIGQLKK